MTTIARVIYHYEEDGWWAESPDVAGWTAADGDLGELRRLVREGLHYVTGAPVAIVEYGLPEAVASGNPLPDFSFAVGTTVADGSDAADQVVQTPWPREVKQGGEREPQLAA